MFETLRALNKDIEFYDVSDPAFSTFGKILKNYDISEIVKAAKTVPNPESGSAYVPSLAIFEDLAIAKEMKNESFGMLPTQVGYCYGYNTLMNAMEYHASGEINIAVTPLVLILGHTWDLKGGHIDSSKFKAFYLPEETVVEVFATTLHFCPCQVQDEGFGCVVGLPLETNTPLTEPVKDPLLFRKSKWLIAHKDNRDLINKGVFAGITGTNFEIHY